MSLTPPIEAPAPDPDPGDPVPDQPDPGQPPGRSDHARQLSLFGVEALEPGPGDLAGLLAGPGQVVRMGGTARVSVVVDAAWRVHVLVAELALRGLTASWAATAEQQHGVRTSYATTLAPLGAAWLRGEVKRPPAGFHLDGPRLRLWAVAAGSVDPLGYLLRLGAADEGCWEAVGAALAGIGLSGVLLGPRSGGPAYRITGRRRLARLAELVGDRPPAAPPAEWPDVAYRRTGRPGGPGAGRGGAGAEHGAGRAGGGGEVRRAGGGAGGGGEVRRGGGGAGRSGSGPVGGPAGGPGLNGADEGSAGAAGAAGKERSAE